MDHANCLSCKKNKSPIHEIAELRINQHSMQDYRSIPIRCKLKFYLPVRAFNIRFDQLLNDECAYYKPL